MKKTPCLIVSFLLSLVTNGAFAGNCAYGCPGGQSGQLIVRPIYTLQNDADSKFARWTAYQVTPVTIDGPSRSRNWKSDPDIDQDATLEPADYKGAHAALQTDRGHQVPLAAFSNTAYWSQTNYLSNVSPQSSNLNQGPWVRLETAVRNLARTGEDVFVVTGPLYEWYFGELPQANETHIIPSGFFKVAVTVNSGWVEASAFIMEQDASRQDDYCAKEVTIDEVELRTGLNIMPALPAYKEYPVEGRVGGLSASLGC